jgi:hypothetical protein
MLGATTDDEPMGRNPGTSEAANLTALKVRGCDLGPRFADLIEASGHVPCFKAVHMNAPSTRVKSIEKLLAPRAVPHMRFGSRPRKRRTPSPVASMFWHSANYTRRDHRSKNQIAQTFLYGQKSSISLSLPLFSQAKSCESRKTAKWNSNS